VHSGCLDLSHPDFFALQEIDEFPIKRNEAILCPAGDPKQVKLLFGGFAQLRDAGGEVVAEPA